MGAPKAPPSASCKTFILSSWFPVFEYLLRRLELNVYYLLSSFFFVQVPAAGVLFLIRKGVKPQDFHLPGVILKALILSGMVSVGFLG